VVQSQTATTTATTIPANTVVPAPSSMLKAPPAAALPYFTIVPAPSAMLTALPAATLHPPAAYSLLDATSTDPTLWDAASTALPDAVCTVTTFPDSSRTASTNPAADPVNASLTDDEVPIELRPQQPPEELTAEDIRQLWPVVKNNMLCYVSPRFEYYYYHACTQKHLGQKIHDAHQPYCPRGQKKSRKGVLQLQSQSTLTPEQLHAGEAFLDLYQEQATIEASLQSSWQNTHCVDVAGELDDDGNSPSDDDPDDPDYKPPASSCHTRPLEESDSDVEEPVAGR